MGIPRWIHLIFLVLTVIAMIPPVVIARARVTKSADPRIHPIPDMDNQKKYRAQSMNPAFAHKRAMLYPAEGTVARGELRADLDFNQGWRMTAGKVVYLPTFPTPVTVDEAFVRRGKDRFNIFCSPCHGFGAAGDGMVANRATAVSQETWNFDLNLHTDERRAREPGYLFNTITNGNNNMPPYRYQIPPMDRWAIVAYVKALQASEYQPMSALPESVRAGVGQLPDHSPEPEVGSTDGGQKPNGDGK